MSFVSKCRRTATYTARWEKEPVHENSFTIIVRIIGQQTMPLIFLLTPTVSWTPLCLQLISKKKKTWIVFHTLSHTCIYVCITYMYVHVYICIYTFTHIHTYMHAQHTHKVLWLDEVFASVFSVSLIMCYWMNSSLNLITCCTSTMLVK